MATRTEQTEEPPTVVVYGGDGFFGRLVVNDLLANTSARITVAGRRPPNERRVSPRVSFVRADLNDVAFPAAAQLHLAPAQDSAYPGSGGRAEMPGEDVLPESLRKFATRNAIHVRPNPDSVPI